MRVEVERRGYLMARVLLLFDEEEPGPEDGAVREFLADRALTPRRIFRVEREGRRYWALQFGLCYLTPHWTALRALVRERGGREEGWDEVESIPRRWEVL